MTVYVDALQVYGHGPRFARQGGSCHLVATTHEELHAFAERLGLRRAWHQLHRLASHYDIAASVRVRAVRLGAVEIAGREMVRLSRAGLLARDFIEGGAERHYAASLIPLTYLTEER